MEDHGSTNAITLNRLLFATDFSAASETAFEYSMSIAERYRAQLYIVHAIDLDVFDLMSSESTTEVLKQAHEEAREKIAVMITARGLLSDSVTSS